MVFWPIFLILFRSVVWATFLIIAHVELTTLWCFGEGSGHGRLL